MEKGVLILLLIGVAVVTLVYEVYHHKPHNGDAQVTQSIDPSTFSNIDEVNAIHWKLNVSVDFNKTIIQGTNEITFIALVQGVNSINLDSKALKIISVQQIGNSSRIDLKFKITSNTKLSFLGEKIEVSLQTPLNYGEKITISVLYETSNKAEALSWLTPEQTASKTQPYLFSQCEPISCRSIAPMQDTPSVKTTWEANVSVPKGIKVFLSSNSTSTQTVGNSTVFSYESTMPMAFYVFAIVAGNVELRSVGKRTGVITEPTNIDAYASELSNLEQYLTTLENYIGAYRWGVYNIVILPPAFPFGGMENPLLTFASPTIIVGDKSGVFVAIHEIAHSWTGNLVTCKNWENMWLNEGFTVFLERKASRALFGTEFYKAEVYEGNVSFNDDLTSYGFQSEYTKLHPVLTGLDPDVGDEIPYEKGFQTLAFIESLIGEQNMQKMLQGYVAKYALQSVDVFAFENFATNFIRENFAEKERDGIFQKLSFDDWIEQPGPVPVPLQINSTEVNNALLLAQAFIAGQGKSLPTNASSLKTMVKVDQYIFFEELIRLSANVTNGVLDQLEKVYQLNESNDAEILQRWFTLTTKINYQTNLAAVESFLGRVGRIKMILPLYSNLAKWNKTLANQVFNKNINFYHPLAVTAVKQAINSK